MISPTSARIRRKPPSSSSSSAPATSAAPLSSPPTGPSAIGARSSQIPPCRTRAKAQGCRTTAELRDNQRQQRLVAPRQSNPNLALASNNPTKHHPFVAVTNPHLDCRALSSRLSRYRAGCPALANPEQIVRSIRWLEGAKD